jgi:hypothetical protein
MEGKTTRVGASECGQRTSFNRTRVAGHLDEIQGVVASRLKLHRQGAVGFIDWLDVVVLNLRHRRETIYVQRPLLSSKAFVSSVARRIAAANRDGSSRNTKCADRSNQTNLFTGALIFSNNRMVQDVGSV